MRVIQGTKIKLRISLEDPDTGAPDDPPEIILTVKPPTLATYTGTLTGGQVVKQSAGLYRAEIDTAPEAGVWQYQVASQGTNARVLGRSITVTPALT